jgi:hypothetical protein
MVAKKPVAKSTTKKVAPKRTSAKKTTVKKTTKKAAPMKSFHLYKESQSFSQFQASRQTVYWVILLVYITIIQLWLLSIQIDIANSTL